MTIAYLILAHNNPRQLARLVTRLPADSPLFVHFDARAPDALFADACAAVRAVRHDAQFVERHRCRWGGAGIMHATLSLIRGLVASGDDFDHATLLSGADYPIRSEAEIAARLASAPGAEHIEAFPMLAPNRWSGHGGNYQARERVMRHYVRLRSRVFRLPGERKVPPGLTPHGGSQWWTLTAPAIRYIDEFARANPQAIRFMGGWFIPDELFVQTILANSPFAQAITGDDLRLIDWSRPEPPWPAVLKAGDLPMIERSNALFARKFDEDGAGEILDLIDRDLLGRERSGEGTPGRR